MSKLITGNTVEEVWSAILRNIMNQGHDIKDERGSNTKEITNLMVTITMPEFSNLPKKYPLQAVKEDYENQLLSDSKENPNKPGSFFVYTYGNRLRKYFKKILGLEQVNSDFVNHPMEEKTIYVDQIKDIIWRLNECRESRRAIGVTYDPTVDSEAEEIPCLILVEFLIRDNNLYVTGLWRSHDMYGGYPANFIALKKLAEFVAEKTDSSVHEITTHSVSAHIYETNFDEAKKVYK